MSIFWADNFYFSFSSILQELRLHLAREYLQEEEVSISQVAWLLGYQDATAFSRGSSSV